MDSRRLLKGGATLKPMWHWYIYIYISISISISISIYLYIHIYAFCQGNFWLGKTTKIIYSRRTMWQIFGSQWSLMAQKLVAYQAAAAWAIPYQCLCLPLSHEAEAHDFPLIWKTMAQPPITRSAENLIINQSLLYNRDTTAVFPSQNTVITRCY